MKTEEKTGHYPGYENSWKADGKRVSSGCIVAKRQNDLEKNVAELKTKIVGA